MNSFSQVLKSDAVSLVILAKKTLLSGVLKIFHMLTFGVGGDKACKMGDGRVESVAECQNYYSKGCSIGWSYISYERSAAAQTIKDDLK